jgi:hypothetical protein
MRLPISIAAFVFATALSAAPVITSVTPNRGSIQGGTTVILKGTGFSETCIICSPPFATPRVAFQGTPATSVKFIDDKTLEVVTPAHLPVTVPVTIHQYDGSEPFILENAFTFEGDATASFDPILFPIFTPPVHGAFGSEFHTRGKFWNEDLTNVLSLYGIDSSCYLFSPVIDPLTPYNLGPSGQEFGILPACSTSIGRIFWVPKGTDTLAANLRVTDVTRQASSHGVEIPVVHRDEFRERVSLLDVPIDARFRNTLRVYSLLRGVVLVNVVVGNVPGTITLQPGENIFEPAYAEFTNFPLPHELPQGQATVRVVVDARTEGTPIWAFITVTNNETQQITTITPN